jgi:hypothetical protein
VLPPGDFSRLFVCHKNKTSCTYIQHAIYIDIVFFLYFCMSTLLNYFPLWGAGVDKCITYIYGWALLNNVRLSPEQTNKYKRLTAYFWLDKFARKIAR